MSDVARVTNILTKNIEPNPHNPRRLFDDEPMRILQESIDLLGILVPLDVYPKDSSKTDALNDTFVLLDGERRWRCALKLNLASVPCIIIDSPSQEQNILTMFHIHNVREGWQLMPTALKLNDLMNMLQTTNERDLAELTKLNISQIRRCKILLSFPVEFQERMLAPPSERYKADFFIDLHRFRGPALEDRLEPWIDRGDSSCIKLMIKKYDNGVIKSVTEFRKLAAIYRSAKEKNRIKRFITEFNRFLDDEEMEIEDFDVPGANFAREIKEINRSSRRLISQIRDIRIETLSSDEVLINQLKKLALLINDKLDQALLIYPKSLKKEE